MNNNYVTFKILFLLFLPLGVMAQLINGDFENIKPNLLPSNWGMNYFQQVIINNETGETTGDQIQYSWCVPSLIYASTEAQSGQYAMELSNAYNLTQNIVIPGEAVLFSDATQDMPGWNPGVPVTTTDTVSGIGFYYKFLPAGNDIAQAKVQVFDIDGNEIGTATIDISDSNTTYQFIYEPILYTSNAAPAYMYVSFVMAKEGSTPTFGSRLIIDNVVTNLTGLNGVAQEDKTKIKIYPTLVETTLTIADWEHSEAPLTYKIINTEGQLLSQNSINTSNSVYTMDLSLLSSGMYFLQIESVQGTLIKKFLKK
jgi:hypothetical protein